MKNRIMMTLLFCSVLAFSFSSCRKKDATPTDADTASAEDNAYSEKTYNDALDAVNEQAAPHSSVFKAEENTAYLTGCATVTLDSTSSPKKLTIDFGTGCTGNDGRTRSGKIIATYTGRYLVAGSVLTITFDNYYVDGNKVEGTKTVTNQGTNAAGNPVYKIEVTGAKITTANGVISWQSSRTREWTKGSSTPRWIWDDEYMISGSASGVNRNGVSFTINITKPLQVKIGCRWIESGTLEVTPSGKLTRTVDYGSGSCDDVATVTIASKVYTVHMR